jgi:hypothetical protein
MEPSAPLKLCRTVSVVWVRPDSAKTKRAIKSRTKHANHLRIGPETGFAWFVFKKNKSDG